MAWDVLGHEWAEALLREHIQRGQVRQAYLLVGASGVGRRTLATRFVQALFCPKAKATGDPCRVCQVCLQVEKAQHPDLFPVAAEQEGGELRIDAIRDLQHSLSLSPYMADRKVGLLLRFEEANQNAQNALLKTLEDTPGRAMLLLTAASAEAVLPTIASRCEVLRLRPMAVQEATQHLVDQFNLPHYEADLLAHVTGGRLGAALRLYSEPERLEQRTEWLGDLFTLLGNSLRERFAYAENAVRSRAKGDRGQARENLRGILQTWLSLWRDVLLYSAGASTPMTNPDVADEIQQIAAVVTLDEARRQAAVLEKSLMRLRSANLQLLLENLLLDLPRI